MSKRFWLPTHKAGELFPKATQAPTKLVIRGIPADTPLYHAVANEFGGRLKTFHAKAQQAYANSVNQVFKTRFTWGDEARATYTNIQGNEILELEVSRGKVEQLHQQLEESPWDWALINFKVPDVDVAQFAAFMVVPRLATYADGAPGVTVDYGDDGHGTQPMSFPDASNTTFIQLGDVTVEGIFTAASLLVDLTVVDQRAAVVADVYGMLTDQGAPLCGLQGNRLPVTYTISMPADPPGSDLSGTSIAGPLIDEYPWSIQGYFWTRLDGDCTTSRRPFYLGSHSTIDVLGTFPAQLVYINNGIQFTASRSGTTLTVTVESVDGEDRAVYGTWDADWHGAPGNYWWQLNVTGKTTGTWNTGNDYHASVNIAYSDESGVPADATEPFGGYTTANGGSQTNYNYIFVPYIHATDLPGPSDIGDITKNAVIAGMIGKGSPEWVFSTHHSDNSTYNVWEGRSIYPQPIPTGILANDVAITNHPGVGAVLDPVYSMPKLGTIVADRRTGALTFRKV